MFYLFMSYFQIEALECLLTLGFGGFFCLKKVDYGGVVPSWKGELGVFVKFCSEPDHVCLKTTIQPVDFHETSSIAHGPANVPAHSVEQVFLGHDLVLAGPLAGALEAFNLNLDSYISHYALVCSLGHAERKTGENYFLT